MANFTITISNSMNLFGGSPSSLWGAWNWNAFKWGDGSADLPVEFGKLIGESLLSDSAIPNKDFAHFISESFSLDSDMTLENLSDGSGWKYIYVSDTTNADQRAIASYTSGSSPSSAWTSATVTSTSWS